MNLFEGSRGDDPYSSCNSHSRLRWYWIQNEETKVLASSGEEEGELFSRKHTRFYFSCLLGPTNEHEASIPAGDGADDGWTGGVKIQSKEAAQFWEHGSFLSTVAVGITWQIQLRCERSAPTIGISLCRSAVGGSGSRSACAEPLDGQAGAPLAHRSALSSFPSKPWAPASTSFGLPKNFRNAVTEFFRSALESTASRSGVMRTERNFSAAVVTHSVVS